MNFERIYVEYYYRYRAKTKRNRFAIAKSTIDFNFTIVSVVIRKIYSFKVQTVDRTFEAPCTLALDEMAQKVTFITLDYMRLGSEREQGLYVEYYNRYRAKTKRNRFAIAKSAIDFNFTIVSIVILKICTFKVQTEILTFGTLFILPTIWLLYGVIA